MKSYIELLRYKPFWIFTSLISILVFLSCSHHMSVTVKSGEELNNGGNPVVVRLYLLKTDVNFQKSTLEAFWKNDKEALGSDLIGEPIEIMLHPSETRKLKKVKLTKETVFIGAAADFYQPDKNQWKYLYDVSKNKGDQVILAVGRDKLIITNAKE